MAPSKGTPLFSLGRVVATSAALTVLERTHTDYLELLSRRRTSGALQSHVFGDWGEVPPSGADARENELSVREGFRVLGSYPVVGGPKVPTSRRRIAPRPASCSRASIEVRGGVPVMKIVRWREEDEEWPGSIRCAKISATRTEEEEVTNVRLEIDENLLPVIRHLAEEQGRSEEAVIETALLFYVKVLEILSEPTSHDRPNIGWEYKEAILVRPPPKDLAEFFSRVDRRQRDRGVAPLSEEEAMEIANEELHAMRRERKVSR